jgi:hypothetical protein
MKREPPKGWKLYVRSDGLTAPAVVVGKDARSCWPHHLTLSAKTHSAICTLCEKEFTAWDALLYLTRNWAIMAENLKRLREDLERLGGIKKQLQREVTNLRATKRRNEKKDQEP